MSDFKKPDTIPKEVIFAVHRALGIGILDCRQLLRKASPLFYARFVEAVTTQGVSIRSERRTDLHDPIEDQTEFERVLEEASELAVAEIRRDSPDLLGRRGSCHLFWYTKKRILREKYDIEWFSPYEMNPHIIFD